MPGFPLDGGRLMRAVVRHVTGDFDRATYVAAATGTAFAYLLMAGGIFMALMMGAVMNGLWFAFIGWFLLSAAQGSSLQVTLKRELGRIRVADAMELPSPITKADATVEIVLQDQILAKGGRYSFVESGGRPIGLVTLHQIKETPAESRLVTTVRSIMLANPHLVIIPLSASLWQAFARMNEAGIGQIPVEQAGQIVGLITRERMVRIIQNVHELGTR